MNSYLKVDADHFSTPESMSREAEIAGMSAIRDMMEERKSQFTTVEQMSLFVGTFNVNGQDAPDGPGKLSSWLCPLDPKTGKVISPPHIYAVGFQELDLSQQAYVYDFLAYDPGNQRQERWLNAVRNNLHKDAEYTLVKHIRLVGILLAIFVRKNLMEHGFVKDVDAKTVPTGILSRMGNKGGCAIRLQLKETTMCFITSHLNAHFSELARRNWDYETILNGIVFDQSHLLMGELPMYIRDHEMCFWFGDLNYRLQTSDGKQPDIDWVKSMANSGHYDELVTLDQLRLMQSSQKAFSDWAEGKIQFCPTYKYDLSTNDFDSSEKLRIPAWTDRILHYGENALARLEVYDSAHELALSDHKPVYAMYSIKVAEVDESKRAKVYDEVIKLKDRIQNEYRPKVELDHYEFNFGDVGYDDAVVRHLNIKAVGKASVTFEFRNGHNMLEDPPPWLMVVPPHGRIQKDAHIQVDLMFKGCNEAVPLIQKPEKLKRGNSTELTHFLILKLAGGGDYFIETKARYLFSCFGMGLSEMAQVGDVVNTGGEQLLISIDDSTGPFGFLSHVPKNIPLPIARLVHHVRKYGLTQSKLLHNASLTSEFSRLRQVLSQRVIPSGESESITEELPFNIHTVALALPTLLDSLKEPVIPFSMFNAVTRHTQTGQVAMVESVLSGLPTHNEQVLRYLVAYFRDIIQQGGENGSDAPLIGVTFGPSILRRNPAAAPASTRVHRSPSIDNKYSEEDAKIASKFVQMLVTNLNYW